MRGRAAGLDFAAARERMVADQLVARGLRDPGVLRAMGTVPRERFVAPAQAASAYEDHPLPIGEGQTISQPYVVAYMIEVVQPAASDRALEIGTGSGYGAAVLASVVAEVYTIERMPGLAHSATARLARLGHGNVHVRCGDGTLGWPEHAPYDVIVVTAGGPAVPAALLAQLAPGGRLVMPVGPSVHDQTLQRVVRGHDGQVRTERLEAVRFVPLIGEQGWPDEAPRDSDGGDLG